MDGLGELDLTTEKDSTPAGGSRAAPVLQTKLVSIDQDRENTRGDLARGLLYLLTFAIGGVLIFIGTGRLEGTVLTQSIFPSLIALAGTALGFYFGSQSTKDNNVQGAASSPPPPTSLPPPPQKN